MKKLLCVIALMALLITPTHAEDTNVGYRKIATPTISLPADTITDVGQYFPSICNGYGVNVFGADVIANEPDNLATGTLYIGTKIKSESTMYWTNTKQGYKPVLHLCPLANAVATATLFCW